MSARPVTRAGRQGWAHHEGHAHGTFETWDDFDPGAGFPPRKLHVFVPPEPGPHPVAYLHDGDAVFWPGGPFGKTWGLAERIDRLRAERRIRPMILVAVHPGDRNAEYTHVDWAHGARAYGRLPAFTDAVADNVKRFVDAAYDTDPGPRANVVIGSSHGGLAAFWMATARPDRFGNAVALSPSFFSGIDSLVHGAAPSGLDGSALLQMAHPTLADRSRRPRLWISWGSRRDGGHHNAVVEALAAHRGGEMVRLLTERYGYDHHPVAGEPRPGAELYTWEDAMGGHEEAAWSWQVGLALQALFPAPSSAPSPDREAPAR